MAYTGTSIVDYLKSVGKPSGFTDRTKLAGQYGISGYAGTAQQNTQLLGLLRKPAGVSYPKEFQTGISPEQRLKTKLLGGQTKSAEDIIREKAGVKPIAPTAAYGRDYLLKQKPLGSTVLKEPVIPTKPTVKPTAPLAKYDEDYLRNRGAGTPTEPTKPIKPTTPLTILDQNKKAREDLADEAQVSADSIFDNLPDTDKIDTRNSVKILQDIKDTIGAGDDAPPKPDSLVDLFNAEKAKLGIEPLETERDDLLAQKDRLQAELMIQAEEAGEQLMSTREIGRAKGSIQKRFDREMALMNIEISAVERTLNNKLNTLEMITTLTQQDFTNSSAYYEEQFDKKIKLYSLLSREEDKEYTRAERAKDEAVVNWDMVTGLLKEQGLTYDSLTPDQKLKIKELEVQGGLPVGIGESLLSVSNPSKDVVMKGTSKDNTQAWIKYSDGSMDTFDTGLTGETDGGATGELIVELEDGSQVDLLTPEGLKKAVEAGYSYEYLDGFLDTNTKFDTGSRAGLLKEAGAVSIKEKEKKEEEAKKTTGELRATIEDYKTDWKEKGDKGAGTREEFGEKMENLFPELTKEEIMEEIYKQVTNEWLGENRKGRWWWPERLWGKSPLD